MKAIISSKAGLTIAIGLGLVTSLGANEKSITEFDPGEKDKLGWGIVNDGVMGGLSRGKVSATGRGSVVFSGNLSLENNGGFSSLRTKTVKYDLSDYDALKMRVKGDGRTYQLRLGSDARYRGMEVSFMGEFKTKKDSWTEVTVPFSGLTGTFRGFDIKDATFNPAKIQRLGVLLADKKAGPFKLEIDWLRAVKTGENNNSANDIVAIAAGDERFSTLVTAVKKAGLVDVLQGDGPFTVFAPTNDAFAALPEGTLDSLLKKENRDKLQSILKYHVVSGSATLAEALKAKSIGTVQGAKVNIAFEDGGIRVNKASLAAADIQASNGVIHVIDSVLLPPEPKSQPKTLRAVAEAAGKFKTLLTAVDAAGLSSALEGDGPLTVFAPTDDAFAALPKGTVESLLKPENIDTLKSILAYHVVSGSVSAGDALNAGTAGTLNGNPLSFAVKNGKLKANDATIQTTDVQCGNGVIHIIDSVLLPPASGCGQKAKSADREKNRDIMSPTALINSAIEKGVPLYNNGNAKACADVYEECLMALSRDGRLPENLRNVFARVVKEASRHGDDSRAWMLRRGLDTTMMYLTKTGHGSCED